MRNYNPMKEDYIEVVNVLNTYGVIYEHFDRKEGHMIALYRKEDRRKRVCEIWVSEKGYELFSREKIDDSTVYHKSYNLQYETGFATLQDIMEVAIKLAIGEIVSLH